MSRPMSPAGGIREKVSYDDVDVPAGPSGTAKRDDKRDGERYDSDRERRRRDRDRDDRGRDRDRDRDRRRSDKRRDDERRERKRDRSRSSSGDRERTRDRDRERRRDRDRDRDRSTSRERRKDRDRDRDRRRDSRSPSSLERRKRKEAKRAAKAASRREADAEHARKVTELTMYSTNSNPFQDPNLTERFTWHKKIEKDKKSGLTGADIAAREAQRKLEAKQELEKLNKRRADRETEMKLREEEDTRKRRLAEDAQMMEWINKEDDFQLEQARRRAGIRLRERRAKAIDFLAINLRFADAKGLGRQTAAIGALAGSAGAAAREDEEDGWGWADAGLEFEMDEPWLIFENLDEDDTVELEQDIKMYLSLEKSAVNMQFWEAMQVVCQQRLAELRDPERGGRAHDAGVDASASDIVAGLSVSKLDALEQRTRGLLAGGGAVDSEFWALVLDKIALARAHNTLAGIHEVVLRNRLELFKQRQREEAARAQADLAEAEAGGAAADADDEGAYEADEEDYVEAYERDMSPAPLDMAAMQADGELCHLRVVGEAELLRALYAARHTVSNKAYMPKVARAEHAALAPAPAPEPADPAAHDIDAATEAHWKAALRAEPRDWGDSESEHDMDDGDLADGLEPAAGYDWADRFRPRKPRYFNRVHTGYEWTQYNQSHYDFDNPPPKVVQGYKFNVFYPDLIDKSVTPTYVVHNIPGDNDTQVIVFKAGPPYEDVAFRIVKKPWEYSHRKGFVSTFGAGVLRLYFSFSRQFYKK